MPISIHALLAESDSFTERRHWQVGQFLSTLSLRRATVAASTSDVSDRISIHALLAESDGLSYFYIIKITYFYPRSPCGERPVKVGENLMDRKNFYPRSPCGERPAGVFHVILII